MEATTYSQFSRSIHERFSGERVPLQVSIELTHRCPLQCLHCYNNLSAGDHVARARELSKEEHFRLLDDVADLGCIWMLYTGGEIFAHKDFLEIYTYAKNKGFLITLFTNGVLINEAIADYLAEWPPFCIEITLYGRTRETYEALTNVPGSYDRCLRAIELLRERQLPLKLKTVCTTVNQHEVQAMRRFAEEELGVEFKFDSQLNARIDCSIGPLAVRLQAEEAVAIDLGTPKIVAEYRKLLERDCQQPSPLADDDHVYVCGGGMNSFSIDPYGRMSICVIARQQMCDIRKFGVEQGWKQFLLRVRTEKRTQSSKCVLCRIQSLCSMCAAMGELEHRDAERPVNFFCEVAHLRAMALGTEVPAHGDCEYCAGGSQYARLQESARRITSGDIDVEGWTSSVLPVVNSCMGAEADCPGCASKRAGV